MVTATGTTRTRALKADAVLSEAVEIARTAAQEVSGLGDVGEYLGYTQDGERLGSHRFATTAPGYRGWHWTVTVARVARARHATICEVELLPGADALLAPAWVPWSERLAPGDIGPDDALPEGVADDRVVPGYQPEEGDPVDVTADATDLIELGAWRAQVPSRATLEAAAQRWADREPARGRSFAADPAAFIVPLSGWLGQLYGVCVNEFSPDDGMVVRLDQLPTPRPVRARAQSIWRESAPVIDDSRLDTD